MEFFMEIGKLKNIERSGWIVEGVKSPESVADHSFRTAFIALVLAKGREDIDPHKAVEMALVHDIAESQIGDILVDWKIKAHGEEKVSRLTKKGVHGVPQQEKLRREKEGMEKLVSLLGDKGNKYRDLWEEFEAGKSGEAKFVKSVDTFEMFLQAFEYEEAQEGIDISAWFDHKQNWDNVKDEQIRTLLLKIVEKRKLRGK